MGEGVGGADLEAAREAVLPGQQQAVIAGVGARVLQGDVVELRIEPGSSTDGGREDGPPIGQQAGGVDEVHVAQEDQVASSGEYVPHRDNVIDAQLAGNLQAGVYRGGVLVVRDDRGHVLRRRGEAHDCGKSRAARHAFAPADGSVTDAVRPVCVQGIEPDVGGGRIEEDAGRGPQHSLVADAVGESDSRRQVAVRRIELAREDEGCVGIGLGRLVAVIAQAVDQQQVRRCLPTVLQIEAPE